MTCRAPVPPLDPLFDTWAVGRVIHVMHETAFAPESFNPGVDGAGRLRAFTLLTLAVLLTVLVNAGDGGLAFGGGVWSAAVVEPEE